MYTREGYIACRESKLITFIIGQCVLLLYKTPWLDPRTGIYTSCSYRQGKSQQAKVHERRRVCIYQAQVVWICLWAEQIRESTVDVTLQTSFVSGEIHKLEETVQLLIHSLLNKHVTSPLNVNRSRGQYNVTCLISCNYMYNIASLKCTCQLPRQGPYCSTTYIIYVQQTYNIHHPITCCYFRGHPPDT